MPQVAPIPATVTADPTSLTGMTGLSLHAITNSLRSHALLIVALGMAGAVGAYAYGRTLPKSYTASSLVAVAGTSFAIPELQGALRAENTANPMPIVRTEMQALTSRDLVLQVVQQLHLAEIPEFNANLRPPSLKEQAKIWLKSLIATQIPTESSDPTEGVLASVTDDIRIFQDNRSLAIDVGFVSLDPQMAATITNTLVTDYIDVRAKRQASANAGANEVVTQRIDDLRKGIADLEKQIQRLRDGNEMVLLRAGSVGQQQVEDLTTAVSKASVDRGQLEAVYNRAASLVGHASTSELSGVLSSPTIGQLRDRETAAAQKVAELSTRYGPNYPGVVSAEADLATARAQLVSETQRIVSSMGIQLKIAREHEADVKAQLDTARRSALISENARAKLKQLQDEVDTRQKLYQTLLERAQQTSTQPLGTRPPDVYVISTAAPPLQPSGPNMKLVSGFGGVAGGTLGCLLALLRLRSVTLNEIKKRTTAEGLPILGRISLSRRSRTGKLTAEDSAAMADLARNLRHSTGERPRVILFASTARTPDVAGAAANAFAIAAHDRGDRVLFLNSDLDRGGIWPAQDLMEVLHGSNWPEASHGPCLTRYAAMQPSPEAALALGSPVFANLVTQAREVFDLVVLLGAPGTNAVTMSLARRADAVVLVLKPGRQPDSVSVTDRLSASTSRPISTLIVT